MAEKESLEDVLQLSWQTKAFVAKDGFACESVPLAKAFPSPLSARQDA